MNSILQLDRELFFFINHSMSNGLFDAVMPWMREKYFWIPLYAALVVYLVFQFRWRSVLIVMGISFTILLADQVSSSVIKPAVERPRPCNDAFIQSQVLLLTDCGPGYSFVSSHAANHFGLAVFLILVLRKKLRWIFPAAVSWAAIISFAQVYVGLHYPLDIFGGMLVGITSGWLMGSLSVRVLKKYDLKPRHD